MKVSDFIDVIDDNIDKNIEDIDIEFEYDNDEYEYDDPEINMDTDITEDQAQTYMNILVHGCTDIINIFRMYYSKLYNVNENVFNNIDYDKFNSTNRWMEVLMEHMVKYNQLDNQLNDIDGPIDLTQYDELYVLVINGIQQKYSVSLISIIKFLAQENWNEINWNIIPMK